MGMRQSCECGGSCREDQVTDEVGKCLQMLSEVYEVFGLSYTAELSTRPESKMGDDSQWDLAESALQNALDAHQAQTGQAWEASSFSLPFPNCRLPSLALYHLCGLRLS